MRVCGVKESEGSLIECTQRTHAVTAGSRTQPVLELRVCNQIQVKCHRESAHDIQMAAAKFTRKSAAR